MGDPSALGGVDEVALSASLDPLMARALKVCSRSGCPNLVPSGRCDTCKAAADKARGTAAQRGYNHHWRRVIQPRFLRKAANLWCVCTDTGHGHGAQCMAPSTVADHHPTTRRDLVDMGVRDPDADDRLRPLCKACHDKHTAATSPGGWHAR